MYRDIPRELREWIEPVVESHALELVDVELHKGRGPWILRVILDTPVGDGRVGVEVCAGVSRELGTHLDAHDAIPVRYRLEVSSPGLDRVLGREKDFAAARGCEVHVETQRPQDGRRRFQGELLDLDAETLRMQVDGAEVRIPFAEVAKANKVYHFTSEDFARPAVAGRAAGRSSRARR
ncbi:MAG TPA: ribosome maturation factor RimP [Myxococcota bacterium]|nr:ribosome maturation factor RimP [Myxococcota bacterium]